MEVSSSWIAKRRCNDVLMLHQHRRHGGSRLREVHNHRCEWVVSCTLQAHETLEEVLDSNMGVSMSASCAEDI